MRNGPAGLREQSLDPSGDAADFRGVNIVAQAKQRQAMENLGHDVVRVTIKQVAQAAKVHYSTVSKALSGRGRIPAATRERIRQIAQQIGYQPDPVMQSLSAQRNPGRGAHREPRIVFLANRWSSDELARGAVVRRLADGVRYQAELMGCTLDLLPLGDAMIDAAEIERQCDPSRTDGIIVGAVDPLSPRLGLDWSRYAVVKIDSAFMLPTSTLVANDQMQVARIAFQNAFRLGYRRIGMAGGGSLRRKPPRICIPLAATSPRMSWRCRMFPSCTSGNSARTIRPPCVGWRIGYGNTACRSSSAPGLRFAEPPRDCGLAGPDDISCGCLCLNDPDPALAGVIQHHFVVGQKAAEALAMLIMHRKQGLATPSAATYVGGTWQDGVSAPHYGAGES